MSLGQKVVLSFNGYWGKSSEYSRTKPKESTILYNTRSYCHAAMWIARKPAPTYEQFSQFATYSYVRSYLGNDSCLPIYKTNPAICDTPHQTHCVGNSIFPHFVMVMTVLWAELWFVVECRALCKKKHLVGILPLSI
jgi:hypothetical protein